MAAGSPATKPEAKPRSSVERAIVWGVIGVLLILVGIEFNWRNSHVGAYEKCIDKIKATEAGDNTFKHKDVADILGGKAPSKVEDLKGRNIANGAKTVEIYSWPSLNPMSPRQLFVYYGHDEKDPDVIGVGMVEEETTEKKYPPPTEEELEAAKKNAPAGGGMMGGPGGMMGGPGRPGGPGAAAPAGEGEEKPADGDKPTGDEGQADEAKPDEKPADETPANETPVDEKPADEKPANE